MSIYEGGPQFRIKISGADAIDFLHRITSNDVRGLANGAENHQCLLTAKGKIIAPFRLRRESDGATLTGPLELKSVVIETIDRYIFSEDVRVEALEDFISEELSDEERIRRGLPKWGVDIDSETIPWEAGMAEYVSTSKGCYTGQETIARIETYGKVARRLCMLNAGDRFALAMVHRNIPDGGTVTHEGAEWNVTKSL